MISLTLPSGVSTGVNALWSSVTLRGVIELHQQWLSGAKPLLEPMLTCCGLGCVNVFYGYLLMCWSWICRICHYQSEPLKCHSYKCAVIRLGHPCVCRCHQQLQRRYNAATIMDRMSLAINDFEFVFDFVDQTKSLKRLTRSHDRLGDAFMMTSSNGNIFHVTGPFWGEFTGHRRIPLTKASDAELWCFLWSAPE